jgi:hypothetical protein
MMMIVCCYCCWLYVVFVNFLTITSIDPNQTLQYHIFDVLLKRDYDDMAYHRNNKNKETLIHRKQILDLAIPNLEVSEKVRICRVPYEEIMFQDSKAVSNMVDTYIEKGYPILTIPFSNICLINYRYEGIMLKEPKGFYERTRTTNLIKAKKFNTYDLLLVGFQGGEGRYLTL